jgi:hypothetical protein
MRTTWVGRVGLVALVFGAAACNLFPKNDPTVVTADGDVVDTDVDTGVIDDTGLTDDTGVTFDTGASDSGAIDSATVDSAAADSSAVDSALVDSRPADVGSDTSSCTGGGTMCGGTCVDITTDRNNCGGCGRTCALACGGGICRAATQVAVGEGTSYVLTEGGALYLTGYENTGVATDPTPSFCPGGGSTECNPNPTRVLRPSASLKQIAFAAGHACSIATDGSVQCWGSNVDGEVGDATSSGLTPVSVALGRPATQVDVGENCNKSGCTFSCALLDDTSVRCWGGNFFGSIGNGTSNSLKNAPTSPGLTGVTQIATGGGFACALASGGVKCWGIDHMGQVGSTVTTTCSGPACQLSPLAVPGLTGVVEISAGFGHACARLSTGSIKCWGNGFYGERGDGSSGTTAVGPAITTVSGISDATQIACGDSFTCARRSDGSLWCWGNNKYGQVGDSSTTDRSLPVKVISSGVTSVALGGFIFGDSMSGQGACAITTSGISCWGANQEGRVGDGTFVDRWAPTPMVWK